MSTKNSKTKSKQEKKKKGKNSSSKIKIAIAILLIIFVVVFIKNITTKEDIDLKSKLFENVETNVAEISKYIVYGTHLNIEGSIMLSQLSASSVDNVKIIMRDYNANETNLETKYEIENNTISFSTGEIINKGLDLESLENNSYYILLKVQYSEGVTKYYSLSNSTDYGNIEYYTITKNNTNNKVFINFGKYNTTPYLNIEVSKANSLPEDVYDIVIDAGHGGIDVGAVSNSGIYYEADIVLDCAKELKTKLENLGFKVFLTRDGTEDEDSNMAYNMYDADGRVTLAMQSNAKILISLHMNSSEEDIITGGVEVYAPSNIDLTFAKLLADNIVTTANTNYSYLDTYKVKDGVYIRNYSKEDIISSNNTAINNGYKPYNLTTSTPYLFMLRETGGIATNAFVDGRNTDYSANKYWNSNVGIESYLVELGYIIVDKDLNNVLNNKELYMEAITNTFSEFILTSNSEI